MKGVKAEHLGKKELGDLETTFQRIHKKKEKWKGALKNWRKKEKGS